MSENLTTSSADALYEAALIQRCKTGDMSAWDTLIRQYATSIYKLAFSLCRNQEDAGDIAGQAYLRIYQRLHTYRNESSFTLWLFPIVRNVYIDQCIRPVYRGHLSLNVGPTHDGEPGSIRDIPDPAPSPETICLKLDATRRLTNAIHNLPAYQRQVIRMYHTEGRSYQEIATVTGLSLGTVKSRLNRARTMLRAHFDAEDIADHRQAVDVP